MAASKRSQGQMSLSEHTLWRTVVVLEMNHRLVRLCQSIPWDNLMEKAIAILYEENGISPELGRPLDLRAHSGAYILQATCGWMDRMSQIRYWLKTGKVAPGKIVTLWKFIPTCIWSAFWGLHEILTCCERSILVVTNLARYLGKRELHWEQVKGSKSG